MVGNNEVMFEVCVDNLVSAIAAEAGGAGRIELCSSLLEGGLTPSVGLLKIVKSKVQIPVFVMIRVRGGDFVYSHDEIEIMKEDIKILKENGGDGFVFGVLKEEGSIDVVKCRELLSLTTPLPTTFHRAFDFTKLPIESLQTIIDLGFHRILTSGQQRTAEDGVDLLKCLVEESKGKVIIVAGAGVTPHNVTTIVRKGGVREVHGSCRIQLRPARNKSENNLQLGSTPDEMNLYVTNQSCVAAIVSQLKLLYN